MPESDIPAEVEEKIRKDYSSKKDKKEKPPKEKLDPVVEGSVTRRKKGFLGKLRESFVGDDAQTIGSFLFYDVIIPATKNMLYDIFVQGAEKSLYGEVRGRDRRPSGSSRTHYEKMYGRSNRGDERRELSSRARRNHEFEEIIFKTRADAEEVLEQLIERIERYDVATVSDFYNLVGEASSFTDERWGWSNLRDARTVSVRGGYLLDLPRTEQVD